MTEPTEDPAKGNSDTDRVDDDWSSGFAEQKSRAGKTSQASGLQAGDDDWASALAEQTAAASAAAPAATPAAGHEVFQPLDDASVEGNSDIDMRSEEHTSELQSLMRISYAVFCLKKKKQKKTTQPNK